MRRSPTSRRARSPTSGERARGRQRPRARTRRRRAATPPRPHRASAISSSGSKAPVFTSPAWAQTMVGPLAPRSASSSAATCMRPSVVDLETTAQRFPSPSSRSARSIVMWRFPPVRTAMGGDPARPSDSTSQPMRSSTAWRAAARHVTCAIWHPVTNENDAVAGIPSRSLSHSPATSSTTAADGPHDDEARVLIPRRRQPVGRERGRERTRR